MYLHIHAVRNTTINRWYHYVICITVQYTTTCFGLINGFYQQPDDGPFIRPKHFGLINGFYQQPDDGPLIRPKHFGLINGFYQQPDDGPFIRPKDVVVYCTVMHII